MFCQNCGKGDQQENTFCRQCGEYLLDLKNVRKRGFSGKTPDENIRTSLFLNLLSSIVSFLMAILLFATHLGRPDTPPVVFLAAALFIVIGIWQMINLVVGLRLKKHFDKRKENPDVAEDVAAPPEKTRELLDQADLTDFVPASVTEQTTKNLTEKVTRRSS